MPPKKLKATPAEGTADPVTVADTFAAELASLGVTSLVKLADEMVDGNVTCISTGFPQLDLILHKTRKGLPIGRDVEIYSRDPEVGKTTLALQMMKNWQLLGKACVIVDVENTVTEEYLADELGILTRPDKARPQICPVYIAGHGEMLAAEEVLDLTYKLSNSPKVDMVVIDSVAGLESKGTLEKDLDEAEAMGGIAKLLSRFCRKNKNKHASVVWINQTRQAGIGQYNPSGQTKYVTPGGRALPFFASIRLELSYLEKIKHPSIEGEFIGFKTKVYTAKNKVSSPFKQTVLTHIFGDGFSPIYDYIEFGLKSGVIAKSGGWFKLGEQKFQGQMNLYNALRSDPDLFHFLKVSIDGEEVQDDVPTVEPEDVDDEAAAA
jgi:recombination protein RecA